MTHIVDETLLMHGGRERSVAATKTFTGQMMLFYMLAAELGGELAQLVLRGNSRVCGAGARAEAGDT